MGIDGRVALVTIAVGGALLAACTTGEPASPSSSSASVAQGLITGRAQGCFGYGGAPPLWPVTVTAMQGTKSVAQDNLLVHNPPIATPSTESIFHLPVPPGTYEVWIAATSLIGPSPQSLGTYKVESGETVTIEMHYDCS